MAALGYNAEEKTFRVVPYPLLLQAARAIVAYANHLVGNPVIPQPEEIEQMYTANLDDL